MNKEKMSHVLQYTIAWGMVAALIVLGITSAIIRDYEYMVKYPLYFTAETLMFAIVPAVIVFIFIKTRGMKVKDSVYMFLIMVVKFGLFHIFLQLSGIYTLLFP